MAGPSDQDKLAEEWGLDDVGSGGADTPVAPADEDMTEEELERLLEEGQR